MGIKNRNNEYAWTQYTPNKLEQPRGGIEQPYRNNNEHEERKCDNVKFPDDTTLKVQNATQICQKLVAFKEATRKYRLPINWNKLVILVKKHDHGRRQIKKIAHPEFRGKQFAKCTTILGGK